VWLGPTTAKRDLKIAGWVAGRKRPDFSAAAIEPRPAFKLATAAGGEPRVVGNEGARGEGERRYEQGGAGKRGQFQGAILALLCEKRMSGQGSSRTKCAGVAPCTI
jgi:hypothetical protein